VTKRSFDYRKLDEVVKPYKEAWVGFDAQQIVEDEENILVTDDNENFALFEFARPGVYYGHYMFKERGKNTINVAKNLLGFFFREFPVRVVLGLAPTDHLGSVRLTRKLGFTFHGVIDTEAGPHYQVSLKKDDFRYE
jgi:hypothetical protein